MAPSPLDCVRFRVRLWPHSGAIEMGKRESNSESARRFALLGGVLTAAIVFSLPTLALAHKERPSYWPDPAPDRSIAPAAGGKVPKARSLQSAVTGAGPGDVRVVCKGDGGEDSLRILSRSVASAVTKGYRLRPSQDKTFLTKKQAKRLLKQNVELAKQCDYHSIQEAVFDSGNNDRVVIMPGRYTEPESRSHPINDPACADLTQLDSSGTPSPSYRYQVTCPNDQNLIYVQGREVPDEPPPSPPLENRQGIPDEGPCVRCNLQIEGSGVKPEDVLLDGGTKYKGRGPEARPGGYAKDVVLRVDRADGFVVRNLLARGAAEHGIYIEETDGYLLDRTKFFWAADYGNLTFTSDHGLYKNCDGFGSGDSVVYPGAAPETGEQADPSFYPDAPRINTVVKKCDMRGSALAYSGSMGNAVRITQNHIYGNTTGIATDTISAGGHPGYPADSPEIDHNWIYANNLDLYNADPLVEPTIGVPIGVGVLWAGVNSGQIHDNYIFDNWRRGTMLLAVPDFLVTPEGNVNPGVACENPEVTTSCGNRYFGNHMGEAPRGYEPPPVLKRLGVPHAGSGSGVPNGTDFWWDEFPGNTGNCWFDNTGIDGTRSSITSDPPIAPSAGTSIPGMLPEDCGSSVGAGDPVKEAVLVDCSMWSRGNTPDDHPACDWFRPPAQPGSAAAEAAQRRYARMSAEFLSSEEADAWAERFADLSAFVDRP